MLTFWEKAIEKNWVHCSIIDTNYLIQRNKQDVCTQSIPLWENTCSKSTTKAVDNIIR